MNDYEIQKPRNPFKSYVSTNAVFLNKNKLLDY